MTTREFVAKVAGLRLSTEGEEATFAEEIMGEDDAVVTLDDLIEDARKLMADYQAFYDRHKPIFDACHAIVQSQKDGK